MYILNLLGNCGNPALANLFNIAQRFITVIQIIAPINMAEKIYSLLITLLEKQNDVKINYSIVKCEELRKVG